MHLGWRWLGFHKCMLAWGCGRCRALDYDSLSCLLLAERLARTRTLAANDGLIHVFGI
jgi:hypothetical protein